MTAARSRQALNSRELWFYVFGVAALLAVIALAAALTWFAAPSPELVHLGSVADFPPSAAPYFVPTENGSYFVLNDGVEITIYDARVPGVRFRCKLVWVRLNERFEDPCTGQKFTRAGEYIEGPATREMDRYGCESKDGELYVNLWELTRGAPVYPQRRLNWVN